MAALAFQRTNSGKAVKAKFVRQKILYVEGVDDVSFFSPLARELEIRCEPAYGKGNILALAEKLVSGARGYSIVMDSDLDDFIGGKVVHPSVYYLPCYSIENLPALDEVVDLMASEYCGQAEVGTNAIDALVSHLQHVGQCYYDIVTYDIATRTAGLPNEVIPDHCDTIFGNKPGMAVCAIWKDGFDGALSKLDGHRKEVQKKLAPMDPYLVVLTYLRGHVIFGLLRRLFSKAVKALTGQKVNVDNRALMRMLSDAFWRNRGRSARTVHTGISAALGAA